MGALLYFDIVFVINLEVLPAQHISPYVRSTRTTTPSSQDPQGKSKLQE